MRLAMPTIKWETKAGSQLEHCDPIKSWATDVRETDPAHRSQHLLFISLHAIGLRLLVIFILCLKVPTGSKPPLTQP